MNIERLKELKMVDSFDWNTFKERYDNEKGDLYPYKWQIVGLIQAIGMNSENNFTYSKLSILDKELLLNELGLIETNKK